MAYQKDISAILGLSISTVSKALKGYSDVSEETRRKVLQTAEEIDYKCRGSGEKGSGLNMASRKAGAIGILLPGCGSVVKNSLFYRRLICGIIEEAAERNRLKPSFAHVESRLPLRKPSLHKVDRPNPPNK